tara:strand:+ start:430 stop:771 length:342 start_codon:yes stop_codon:yes gene_type:complete
MRLKTVAFLLVFLMSSYSLASEGDKNHLDGMTLLAFIHYVAKRLDQTVIISPRVRTNKKLPFLLLPAFQITSFKKYFENAWVWRGGGQRNSQDSSVKKNEVHAGAGIWARGLA